MKKLSSMIKSKKPLVIPGVYDAMGKIAEKVGFDAMFQAGDGTGNIVWNARLWIYCATETVDNAEEFQMQFQFLLLLIQIQVMEMH